MLFHLCFFVLFKKKLFVVIGWMVVVLYGLIGWGIDVISFVFGFYLSIL